MYVQNDKFIQGNSFQHYNSKRLETIYMFISKGQAQLHTSISVQSLLKNEGSPGR